MVKVRSITGKRVYFYHVFVEKSIKNVKNYKSYPYMFVVLLETKIVGF